MKKEHSDALFDLLRRMTLVVEEGVGVKASTIAIHNGTDSGQEIPHVHVHIIPRTIADGAAPIHSLFKNRPQISSRDLDLILEQIKEIDLRSINKSSSY
jgi:histidine triad (HIT) family protein